MADLYPRDIPNKIEGLEALYKRLGDWKAADSVAPALQTLTLGTEFVYRMSERELRPRPESDWKHGWNADFINCQQRCAHFEWPPTRPKHNLQLEHSTISNLSLLSSSSLKPVYVGNAGSASSLVRVLVKVYQGSRQFDNLKDPATMRDIGTQDSKYYRGMYSRLIKNWLDLVVSFRAEALAYCRMTCFQGSIVPHVYGFFQVSLPNQEPAMVVVMEYVEEDLNGLHTALAQTRADTLDEMGMGMFAALHAMTNCQVFNYDLNRGNVLWPSGNVVPTQLTQTGLMRFPVLIDFDSAGKLSPGSRLSALLLGLGSLKYVLVPSISWARSTGQRHDQPTGFDTDEIDEWILEVMERRHPDTKRLYESYDKVIWEAAFTKNK